MPRQRLDTLLVDRGLAESREKAQALVMAGQVRIGERAAVKPGVMVAADAELRIARGPRFVSRGGEKLAHALTRFGIDVTGLVGADLGSSTGGFTDCLLRGGASKVYAVDVGRGQLDYRLRCDDRVVVMEGTNAREMAGLPEPVSFVTVDVSFISLRLVLPVALRLLRPGDGIILALFKPQFEARKGEVPAGGVITDPFQHALLIGRFAAWCVDNAFRIVDMAASPILGAEGNREFLFYLTSRGRTAGSEGAP
jgi:23S rRNA (cytidine1920-2'-O)/16S rRNA (cytidine1409-2'-O)-methyltransferase